MLWQPSLPSSYLSMSEADLGHAIEDRRRRLGDRLVILGHHYQVDEVIRHADYTGDSLKLSQLAADLAEEKPIEHVIFCGVHFMAETADMLTPEHVRVLLPDLSAGCSMADMAAYDETTEAWEIIHEALDLEHGGSWHGRVIPITYVNSSAAIKAFVGSHEGACCTSSNASRVFEWAMNGGVRPREPGEEIKILFLPDQHLGRNTAAAHGIDVASHTCVYDPKQTARGEPFGGATSEQIAASDVILWAGHCSVHKLFRPEHCDEIRAANGRLDAGTEPMRIMVHPECAKEVVDKSDLSGSTERIIREIESSPPGSRWAVGTEFHLVNRLAHRMRARGVEVRILSDCQCLCTTMYRIDEPHLVWTLDGLLGIGTGPEGEDGSPISRNQISVHPEVAEPARLALDRMLALRANAPAPA